MSSAREEKGIQLSEAACLPINPINESFTEISKANKQRIASGLEPIINLGIGAPHLPVPKIVLEAMIEAYQSTGMEFKFGYSPSEGRDETLEAIVKLYKTYYPKAEYKKDEVMVTMGASGALDHAFEILLERNRGDEVLVFEPYYSYYADYVNDRKASIVMIPTHDNQFRPSAEKLDLFLSKHPKVKAVVLNYPNNPSNIDLSKEEITTLVDVLNKYSHVAIIHDDVYRDFATHEHVTPVDINPALKNRCIMINSTSKGLFGGPDLRGGFVGANPQWITKMAEVQDRRIASVSLLQQIAIIKVINLKIEKNSEYVAWLTNAKKTYCDNINYFSKALSTLGFESLAMNSAENGFYILANASFLIGHPIPDPELRKKYGHDTFLDDADIAAYFMQRAGVGMIRGSAFGIDKELGYLRFSCAQNLKVLEEAVKRIENALKKDMLLSPEVVGRKTMPQCKLSSHYKSDRFWSSPHAKTAEDVFSLAHVLKAKF